MGKQMNKSALEPAVMNQRPMAQELGSLLPHYHVYTG